MMNLTYPYNLSAVSNVRDLSGMATVVNDFTDGMFFGGLMIIIFIIFTVMALQKLRPSHAFMVSGYTTFITSLFLWNIGLVSMYAMLVFGVIAAIATMATAFGKSSGVS